MDNTTKGLTREQALAQFQDKFEEYLSTLEKQYPGLELDGKEPYVNDKGETINPRRTTAALLFYRATGSGDKEPLGSDLVDRCFGTLEKIAAAHEELRPQDENQEDENWAKKISREAMHYFVLDVKSNPLYQTPQLVEPFMERAIEKCKEYSRLPAQERKNVKWKVQSYVAARDAEAKTYLEQLQQEKLNVERPATPTAVPPIAFSSRLEQAVAAGATSAPYASSAPSKPPSSVVSGEIVVPDRQPSLASEPAPEPASEIVLGDGDVEADMEANMEAYGEGEDTVPTPLPEVPVSATLESTLDTPVDIVSRAPIHYSFLRQYAQSLVAGLIVAGVLIGGTLYVASKVRQPPPRITVQQTTSCPDLAELQKRYTPIQGAERELVRSNFEQKEARATVSRIYDALMCAYQESPERDSQAVRLAGLAAESKNNVEQFIVKVNETFPRWR